MIVWYFPDPLLDQFDLIPVTFPRSTTLCEENRGTVAEKCSSNITIQRGNKEGSCGYIGTPLKKLFASEFGRKTEREPEATRSPAYKTLQDFKLSGMEMSEIFREWTLIDPEGDNREAVCTWVATNLNQLLRIVPPGYPRIVDRHLKDSDNLQYGAIGLASFIGVVVLITIALTNHWKEEKPIKTAQINFLNLILLGYFFLSVGSILRALDETVGICIAEEWLEVLGFVLAFVPLLVKARAITVIDREARQYRRVTTTQETLYRIVAGITGLTIIYLIV
eukprot:2165912-Ditylum_brightwellii.AAC.1